MAAVSATSTIWGRLSPSCKGAFEWAAALDPDTTRPRVFSENLLLGLIQVHRPTGEPQVLLEHFGGSVADFERQVQRTSRHHQSAAGDPPSLRDMPPLSRNTQLALDEAARLAAIASTAGTIHAPHLFGGLLTRSQSYAFRALNEALGEAVDLGKVATSYIADFLRQGPSASFKRFLATNFPVGRHDQEVSRPPRDRVEWLTDAPATRDLLKRKSLAAALAERLRRICADENAEKTSFLVHIDGPWGSGKSTLLQFLREDLAATNWAVVSYDAWRQSRVGPPWWSLLMTLRHDLAHRLDRWARYRLRFSEGLERIRRGGAPYVLSLVLLALVAIGLFALLRPQRLALTDVGNIARSVGAIVATVGALGGGTLLVSRFLLWDSAVGARLYEQSHQNPMESLAAHFAWLVERAGRPVVFFIDDLDRCNETYVVDLLDSIQTLIRNSPKSGAGARPRHATYFVVAADGAWLRSSYERAYLNFERAVGQPGRPLGYLFLDKIFQLTVPVPWISAARQESYLRDLIGMGDRDATQIGTEKASVEQRVQASTTRDEGVKALEGASPEVRRELAPLLVKKLNDVDVSRATEHALTKFATLLEPNPRAIKRFLNAFAIADSVLVLQDVFVEQDTLALWTILRIRWPALGDYLRAQPDAVKGLVKEGWVPKVVPDDLAPLFQAAEVATVVGFAHGGPLTPESIRMCSGITVGSNNQVVDASVLKPGLTLPRIGGSTGEGEARSTREGR